MLNENELWILSFYRTSELSGALFFGGLARALRPSQNQVDMSKHFADEAQHAWAWTSCIEQLGAHPLKLADAYQDQYAAAAGLPANLMEVLALTQVFERRVISQYAHHQRVRELHPRIAATLAKIMQDERWHLDWVRRALRAMESQFEPEEIQQTIQRFQEADREVYEKTIREHEQRIEALRLGR